MQTNQLLSITFLAAALASGAHAADRTGVTADSIKIGVFGPLTGPASVAAKTIYGAVAIYKDVNDHGGIHGRKLELIVEDDGCDGTKGIAAVNKLIAQDKAFLLHGAYCSAVALAIKPEIARHPTVPYIVLNAANPAISYPVLPNIFQATATAKILGEQMVEFALSKPGAKAIAIVKHSDNWAGSYFNAAVDKLKDHGIEPVKVLAFERGSTDATVQALAIKEAHPDAVLALLYPAELAIYLRESYKFGVHTTTVATTAVSLEDTDKRIGIPAAVKDLYIAYNLSGTITSPQLSKYAEIFRRYYPSESLDAQAFDAMGGAIAIVEALNRSGPDVSRESFLAEMEKLTNFDTGVQAGLLNFTPSDHAGLKTMNMIALVNKKPTVFSKYPSVQQ